MKMEADVIIVGSGAGGIVVAKELAERGRGNDVVVVEAGPYGKREAAITYYDRILSEQRIEIARALCVGGTTLVTAGNGPRSLEKELKSIGIDLEQEFSELESEIGIKSVPENCYGEGTKKLVDASAELGYKAVPMPKVIDFDTCMSCRRKPCGECVFGCPTDAKWTAASWVAELTRQGVTIQPDTKVEKVIIENGRARGVLAKGKEFRSNMVILAAGALETPKILLASDFAPDEVGKNLFIDPYITVAGVLKGIKFNEEATMQALISDPSFNKFILSPHFARRTMDLLNHKGYDVTGKDILGLMIKIKDEMSGRVRANGTVEKYMTDRDSVALLEGTIVATEILERAGVEPKSICTTSLRGGHPGGTAAIGKIVKSDLETEIEGLFIADASVLPEAPGAPPMLTIMALAKRLGRHLTIH
ncbi:MAG: GMC family oxidoreductase [Methanophagales archaeon]|nr:GMC family oxidoreductase [Methanophagales archaeon]